MLYIPVHIILFLHVLIKKSTQADLMWGHVEVPEGKCPQYVPVAAILPFMKGMVRASTLGSPLKATIPTQLTRCMHRLSHQNKSWCHWSIMWWHLDDVRDFGMMTFMSALKGIKGGCMIGWGFHFPNHRVPGFQFKCIEPSLTSSGVLWCVPALS